MQRLGFYKDGDEHGQSFGEDDASEADGKCGAILRGFRVLRSCLNLCVPSSGDPVSKAFSTSYFKPRSLASYESYLRCVGVGTGLLPGRSCL